MCISEWTKKIAIFLGKLLLLLFSLNANLCKCGACSKHKLCVCLYETEIFEMVKCDRVLFHSFKRHQKWGSMTKGTWWWWKWYVKIIKMCVSILTEVLRSVRSKAHKILCVCVFCPRSRHTSSVTFCLPHLYDAYTRKAQRYLRLWLFTAYNTI